MARTVTEDQPEPREPHLTDAVFDAVRGAMHIVGGMVQVAAGITKFLAIAALKAATVVESAVKAAEDETKP